MFFILSKLDINVHTSLNNTKTEKKIRKHIYVESIVSRIGCRTCFNVHTISNALLEPLLTHL